MGLGIKGKVVELKAKIDTYFKENPGLCSNPRLCDLFSCPTHQSAATSSTKTTAQAPKPALHTESHPSLQTLPIPQLFAGFTLQSHQQLFQAYPNNFMYMLLSSMRPLGPNGAHVSLGYMAHIPPYYTVNSFTCSVESHL